MLIKDWLGEFVEAHQARHPREDWPDPESPGGRFLWATWFDGAKSERITADEMDVASRAIDGSVLRRWEDHLPALLAAVARLRETAVARAASPASEHDRLIGLARQIQDELEPLSLAE